MEEDKRRILEDKEAVNNVALMNFEIAQRDADRIAELSKKLNQSNKELKLELRRQKEQKKYLYEEIRNRLDGLREEYNKYRDFVETELEVKDAIIDRQSEIIKKMYNELRATKVLLEIPRLQQKMTKYDLKGVDFVNLSNVLDQINREVRTDL